MKNFIVNDLFIFIAVAVNRFLAKYFNTNSNNIKKKIIFFIHRLPLYFKKYGFVLPIKFAKQHSFYAIVVVTILSLLLFSDNKLIIFGFTFLASIIALGNKYINTRNLEFNMTINPAVGVNELDAVIQDCLAEYLIFNRYEGETFITNEEETKLQKEMMALVATRMSPTLVAKLRLVYQDDALYTAVGVRVVMAVMNYVITNNRVIDNNKIAEREAKRRDFYSVNHLTEQDKFGNLRASLLPFMIRQQKDNVFGIHL